MDSAIAFDRKSPANFPHRLISDAPVYAEAEKREKYLKIKFISGWDG
jgi:hypothetical protein